MYTNEILSALVQKVADALKEPETQTVALRFDRVGGEWGWGCYVDARTRPCGRGRTVVRNSITSFGPTPEAAVDDVLRKIAIPGYLVLK